MLLKLLQVGEPLLREKARPLSREEIVSSSIQELVSSMRETLHAAPGVGLAAPQVGVPLQLAIIEDVAEYWRELSATDLAARERKGVPFHMIANPRITHTSNTHAKFFEGCLSLDGFTAVVSRAREVTVECLDHRGDVKVIKACGWYARILQHEIDHLNGALYIDRMESRTFMSLDNYKRYWKEKSPPEIKPAISV